MTASPLPLGDPKALGFDPERLNLIGPAMQRYVDEPTVPNLITLLARHGQIVHFESRGVLDFDTGVEAGKRTLCRMWSNTKPIAGVATMILFERGVLSPDDPVAKFLPEWANQRVLSIEDFSTRPARRPMTVRDCLTHTTGLFDPSLLPYFVYQQHREVIHKMNWYGYREDSENQERLPIRERMRALAELPLRADPGEQFAYHMGYPVLTAVLEEAAGQNLDQFFSENIFEPLGMNDTSFYLKDGGLERFGALYSTQQVDDKVVLVATEKAETSEKSVGPRTEFSAGGDMGGVLSTAGDYARLGQMLLNGGELDGVRILGRKTVDMMIGNHSGDVVNPMTGPGFHWGLGVAAYHGRGHVPLLRSVGTYGWDGAAGTYYFADPTEGLLGVCLTQVLGGPYIPDKNYQERFRRLAYQALV